LYKNLARSAIYEIAKRVRQSKLTMLSYAGITSFGQSTKHLIYTESRREDPSLHGYSRGLYKTQ
jgi:hypothetical protein